MRRHEPWLEWSGKREKPWFEVDPVPLHMHERVSTQAVLRVLAREDIKRDLFAEPCIGKSTALAVEAARVASDGAASETSTIYVDLRA